MANNWQVPKRAAPNSGAAPAITGPISEIGNLARLDCAAAGFGLRGMAERVAIVGGSCELDCARVSTRLGARIPAADL